MLYLMIVETCAVHLCFSCWTASSPSPDLRSTALIIKEIHTRVSIHMSVYFPWSVSSILYTATFTKCPWRVNPRTLHVLQLYNNLPTKATALVLLNYIKRYWSLRNKWIAVGDTVIRFRRGKERTLKPNRKQSIRRSETLHCCLVLKKL